MEQYTLKTNRFLFFDTIFPLCSHQETKAILQTMSQADAIAARERERQQERLERIRRQKKFLAEDRTAQAMKLLEKALEMDRV